MKTEQIEIYSFDELDDTAKQRAMDWYRQGAFDYDWWDFPVDDMKEIGKLIGIDIDHVYFSGFSSQGDGACFVGDYAYSKGSVKAVREYAPQDVVLQQIADNLRAIQRRNFYSLRASVSHTGRYSHEYSTYIDVEDMRGGEVPDDTAESLSEVLRDFMHWIYRRLESEYDYLNSDEQVTESIITNEWEFTIDGSPA